MRIALRYARSGPAKYTSHLDMQRAFGRAVRRARIPALYSRGFNPHLIMSFASPLSVGYGTQADYLELEVEDGTPLRQIFSDLGAAMPPGLELLGVYRIPDGTKKLMALSDSAAYTIRFDGKEQAGRIQSAAQALAAEESHPCRDRKGREVDLGRLIYRLAADGCLVELETANGSSSSLNPDAAAREILRMAGTDVPYEICRTECYALQPDGTRTAFRELFPECVERT